MARLRNLLLCSSLSLGAVAPSFLASDAIACGGLFCNAATPVNQAAERIIFAKNDDGTVTAVIEIMYEGPAHEFAWVLPVPPGKTEVGVSSKEALDSLNQQSNPQYFLNQTFDDSCDFDRGVPGSAPAGEATNDSGQNGIQVVTEGNAGPYVYQQIMADPALKDPAAAAVAWLEENGYDVTKLGPKLLGEYLADGMNLIAFKLQKGKNAGSIRPVMLTYKGERPMIPIRPTAVAANENMGVKVWLLGSSRAISNNYPDLVLNESLIDWFNPNNTYNDVVIAAANETEAGQGFVTEQSGPAAAFAQNMYPSWQADAYQQLRTRPFASLLEFFQATTTFAGFDGYNDLMLDPTVIPLRAGATHEQFLTCMECYFQVKVPVRNEAYPETPYPGEALDPIHSIDPKAFLATFYTLIIEPLEKTQALFESHSAVTRFYTTLSPDEMTVDPEFDFNPNLPDVSNVHTATQILSCNDSNTWTVELPQGMRIRGEGRTWPVTLDEEIPVNLRIVQLSKKGGGDVLTDNSKKIAGLLTDLKLGEATSALTAPPPKGTDDPDAPAGDDAGAMESDPERTDGQDAGAGDADSGAPAKDSVKQGVKSTKSDGGCSVSAKPRSSWGFLAALGLVLPLLRRRRSRH